MATCIALAPQPPSVSTATQYTVRAGDTMVAIAARFGFASWREIYYHPSNESFRRKRPNPDKIFLGDVLQIPSETTPSSDLPGLVPGTNFMPFSPLTYPEPAPSTSGQFGVKPKYDQFDVNCRYPGGLRIRLTLFWVTNCINMDSVASLYLAKTEELFAKHGFGLDIYPSRHRTDQHTIETPKNVIDAGGLLINSPPEHNHYNEVRLLAAKRFDDQKVPGKLHRLPVIFCEFRYPAKGVTVIGSPWLPYVLISGNIATDRATLAHEIIHAAGFGPHIPRPLNVMADCDSTRHEIYCMHVKMVAKAYFTR